jgi:ubiquinone/menaquinone biosynthesis C-methylase UbiE
VRRLEIGPGSVRLPGFETLNVLATPSTDHIGSAQRPPFPDATFDEVYSSHCIEHVEWYEIEATIREWARILKPGGLLEVHTVDATPWLRAIVEWEETGASSAPTGKWRADLHQHDPYKHAVGRILCYSKKGDGGANMHRAILTPRYLRQCFEQAGLVEIEAVAEPRGQHRHRLVNMGLRGRKG